MGIFKCALSLESNSCIWAVPKRMKSASTELIFAMRLKRHSCIYTPFKAARRDTERFNLQLQMHQ